MLGKHLTKRHPQSIKNQPWISRRCPWACTCHQRLPKVLPGSQKYNQNRFQVSSQYRRTTTTKSTHRAAGNHNTQKSSHILRPPISSSDSPERGPAAWGVALNRYIESHVSFFLFHSFEQTNASFNLEETHTQQMICIPLPYLRLGFAWSCI